jgi:multiple sugar transport system ATP-binding protein
VFPDLNVPANAKTIGLRTEHLKIARSDSASATGKVTWVEHLGDQDYLHIDVQNHDVVTLSDPDSGLKTGDTVRLTPISPLYFDDAGNRVRA